MDAIAYRVASYYWGTGDDLVDWNRGFDAAANRKRNGTREIGWVGLG